MVLAKRISKLEKKMEAQVRKGAPERHTSYELSERGLI